MALSTCEIKLAGSAGLLIEWSASSRLILAEDGSDYGADRRAAEECPLRECSRQSGLGAIVALRTGDRTA